MKILLRIFVVVALFSVASHGNASEKTIQLSGTQVKACLVASREFERRKPTPNLANYTIEIIDQTNSYHVAFVPNLAPGEKRIRGGRTKLGQEVNYLVSKDTFLIERTFYGR